MVDRRQAYNTERHEASSVAETGSYDRGSAIDFEQLGKGTKEPLGMAKRKMKDHADRQRCLDRNVRIGALATGLAGDRSTPGIERSIGKPDRQVTTLLQPGLALRPIPYPISRLRVLVLASLRIFPRAWTPDLGLLLVTKLDQEPCTNAAYGHDSEGRVVG